MNYQDFKDFLDFFLVPKEQFCIQLIPEKNKLRPKGFSIKYENSEVIYGKLLELCKQGYGVYWCVNRTNGKRRKAENIIAIRAIFADFDTPYLDRLHLVEPYDVKVQTSSERFHIYWKKRVALGDFKSKQRELSEVLGSDKAVCDLSRVMRLPGFYNHKRGFWVRLIRG